jgi:hypothetical protein
MDRGGKEVGGVDWIYVAQYKDQCQVLLNTVINFGAP